MEKLQQEVLKYFHKFGTFLDELSLSETVTLIDMRYYHTFGTTLM